MFTIQNFHTPVCLYYALKNVYLNTYYLTSQPAYSITAQGMCTPYALFFQLLVPNANPDMCCLKVDMSNAFNEQPIWTDRGDLYNIIPVLFVFCVGGHGSKGLTMLAIYYVKVSGGIHNYRTVVG